MSIKKKLLTLVLVVLLAFNMFLISASAVVEPTSLVGIDVNLEVGTYDINDEWVPWDGEALLQNDIITVRVAPTTDYFTGACKIHVMFTTAYLQIQGSAGAAYTVNTENTFYATSCTNYSGTTNQIPEGSWPAALKSTAKGGDGSFTSNTAVSWTTAQSGTYPSHLPGTWLFSFDLKVLQDITAGSGAKVWMSSEWIKSSTNTKATGMISKNLDDSKLTTVGTSQMYPFTFDLSEANRSLEPYSNAPQDLIVTTTQVDSDFVVNIENFVATDQYQIWSYQKVTSDDLLDITPNVKANQWILSHAYTAGSLGAPSAPPDGTINFTIPVFTSPTDNFVIAVRVIDEDGNFKQEVRDAYTPEELGIVVIDKVLVDGAVTTGYELKEIKFEAATTITVIGNDVANIVYSAKTIAGPTELVLQPSVSPTNEFVWDISSVANPGVYTVEITATNSSTTATQVITFELFSAVTSINYGTISAMDMDLGASTVDITPTFANGPFTFMVKEPGRAASFRSVPYTTSGDTIAHPKPTPGIYNVYGYVTRAGLQGGTEAGSFDDGMIRTLVIPREDVGEVAMTFIADPNQTEFVKGTPIVFTANATGLPSNVQYSFWRYDATGYVLVKDWSTSPTLAWTPARIGEYKLEARAKGDGAGSYEINRYLTVNITDAYETKAIVTGITINETELNNDAQAKQPIMIKAVAVSERADLLYKFYVYDADMRTTQLIGYSVNPYCVWTPRKAGMTYTISVLVKSDESFGKYDAIASFDVTV